jgi:hypothetical protein
MRWAAQNPGIQPVTWSASCEGLGMRPAGCDSARARFISKCQLPVTRSPGRLGPLLSGVEAAARHAHAAAQEGERVVRHLRRDEAKPHPRSLANKASVLSISRSSRAPGFPSGGGRVPRARVSSSRSCHPTVGAGTIDPLAQRRFGQVKSRATLPTLLPSSSTSRAA